jgi:hypothetical protein
MTDAPETIWAKCKWDSWLHYGDWDASPLVGGTKYIRVDIAQARIAELEAALTRQGDNMAFILNHMEVKNWYNKFTTELAEDRAALKAKP